MSAYPVASATLLGLPPEIRRKIFTALFRSVTFHSHRPCEQHLSILRVCRQVYNEAEPLVLPNARVYCKGNAALLDTLGRMRGPQIAQLRHLIVSHSAVGFRLDLRAEDRRAGDASDEDDGWVSDTEDHPYYYDEDADVRYFQLGALLGLFPGLRLDLLEVFSAERDSRYTGQRTTDCFGSLLEADGYRRLWMHVAAGDGDGDVWVGIPYTEAWKGVIVRKFKPHAGWRVQIGLRKCKWDDRLERELWVRALDAGIALVEAEYDERGGGDDAEGHGGEDVVDIVVDRGHTVDIAIKEGDRQVLRCVGRGGGYEHPRFFRRASDALRKLVRKNSWEAIKVIDVYNASSRDSIDHQEPGCNQYSV